MNQDRNQKRHSIRRIVLPSGRAIEVVRFDDELDADRTARLHMCPNCESDLVQPIAWSEADCDRWELTLHCPNCDWSTQGIYHQDDVMALEEVLDHGVSALLQDLKRLASANMSDEIERFVAALDAGMILPEDF